MSRGLRFFIPSEAREPYRWKDGYRRNPQLALFLTQLLLR